ncbi:hypothetical protein A2U01_0060983, partial [Trifolium medium]|nr:hypothetical protein [Trifolium medium]
MWFLVGHWSDKRILFKVVERGIQRQVILFHFGGSVICLVHRLENVLLYLDRGVWSGSMIIIT